MKKSLMVFSLLAGAVSMYAQGGIRFDDYVNNPGDVWTITVWAPQGGGTTQVFGNSAADFPAGTQTFTGAKIGGGNVGSGPTGYGNGNNYSIALYAASTSGSTVVPYSGLTAVPGALATFDTSGGATPSAGYAGQWDASGGVTVQLPGINFGTEGTFALAAWYNGGGTISFAHAMTPGSGDPAGWSQEANITIPSPTSAAPSLNPISSFSLLSNSVPEPSTVALGVMGASAFLMRLRRKN